MKKINDIQDKVDKKILKFINKNKKHIQLAVKTLVFMLVTAFIAGFVRENSRDDYIVAFIYVVLISIFIYFVPFERIFFPSYYQNLDNENNKK